MFSKLTTQLYTFAFASSLNIYDASEAELKQMLAEITLADLPLMEWEPDTSICHSWVSFKDWDLKGLCAATDEGAYGNRPRDSETTIQELKNYAEMNGYDGFSIFYGEPDQQWKREGVWYKKCEVGEQENALLPHALTK